MRLLTSYALFGHDVWLQNVDVTGDVAVSNAGILRIDAPSSIAGNVYLGSGVSKSGPGAISGTTTTGLNLMSAQSQVITASNTLAGLTADYTINSITSPQTYSSTGEVTVVDVGSIDLGNGENIYLSGNSKSVFVVNVSGIPDFTGNASIVGLNGVTAAHIILNFYANVANLGVIADVNNVLNGTILLPYADATLHSANGAIYAGTNALVSLASDASVRYVPFASAAVPEPASLVLIGSGLALLARRLRRKPPPL
jgi:hypothetical protein